MSSHISSCALWLHPPLELVSKYHSIASTLLGVGSGRWGRGQERRNELGWEGVSKAAGSTLQPLQLCFQSWLDLYLIL